MIKGNSNSKTKIKKLIKYKLNKIINKLKKNRPRVRVRANSNTKKKVNKKIYVKKKIQ